MIVEVSLHFLNKVRIIRKIATVDHHIDIFLAILPMHKEGIAKIGCH